MLLGERDAVADVVLMILADSVGGSRSWGLTVPIWFSTKKYGRLVLPMSWYSAQTPASSALAPMARAARSTSVDTRMEWL